MVFVKFIAERESGGGQIGGACDAGNGGVGIIAEQPPEFNGFGADGPAGGAGVVGANETAAGSVKRVGCGTGVGAADDAGRELGAVADEIEEAQFKPQLNQRAAGAGGCGMERLDEVGDK